ncbi:MAG: glycosyltransferase family 4 protein [Bacteroidia bacterium]|nr:glycosyltransferase family 4 protein [Bacteroidia bacterium]
MSKGRYIFIVQVTRQLLIDIINAFVKEGAEIELVTGSVEPNYATLDSRVKIKYFNRYDNTSTFKRMFTWSVFTFFTFFYVLFRSRKKELILISTPPFIFFIGSFFKRIRGHKYHLIIWDLYPDVLVNFGVAKKESFIIRTWSNMNRRCFDNSDSLFTLGKHLQDAVKAYTSKEVVIIPNWVNADFVKPVGRSENPFVKAHGLEEKLVVMYSGNMGLTHDIESIVMAAELLKANARIHFVLIGDGAKRAKVETMVKDKSLVNVLMLPYQDKEMLPYSLTSADIGVVTLSQGAESISVPSKTYYTLAAGSAVLALAAKESELGILVEEYKCGKVFDNATAQEIADYILLQLEDRYGLEQLKKNARAASFDFTPANANVYYDYICSKNQ